MRTEFKGENHSVVFDTGTGVVAMRGTFRLNGALEYAPVAEVLSKALENDQDITLDLRHLDFLNSSGIATLSKFVIEVRNRGGRNLRILGAAKIAWQSKSLINLQRLMPSLTIAFQD